MTAPRLTRTLGLVGSVAIVALTLTGCIKVDADVAVNPDATASGTFAFELQKEAAGFLGISDLATFESQISEGDLSGNGGLGTFDSCEPSESDTGYVYSCVFTDLPFTDPADGPWTITKDGDLLTFSMVSEAQDAQSAESQDLLGDANMGSITVDVTFPGTITSVTGQGVKQTGDTTATVSGSLTETINATITAEAGSSMAVSALLVVLLVVGIIALIAVVAVVLIMRRRSGGEEEAAVEAAPLVEETVIEETVTQETVADETVTQETVVEETVVEETVVEETVAEDTAVEEPTEPETPQQNG